VGPKKHIKASLMISIIFVGKTMHAQDIVNPKVADIENINVSMKKENSKEFFFLCQKNKKNKNLSSCEMSKAHENRTV
jgi:hypothetical protein